MPSGSPEQRDARPPSESPPTGSSRRARWPALAAAAGVIIALAALVLFIVESNRPRTSPLPAAPRVPELTAPPRIVALAPAIASNLRAANLGHLIIGRHAFDSWSAATIPVVGDQEGIDFEKLIAVRPTHVFLQWGARALPARLWELAEQNNWELVNYPLLTLDDTMTAADDMVARVQRAAAQSSAPSRPALPTDPAPHSLTNALATVFSSQALSAQQRTLVGPVLILHTTSPPAALGPGSYHYEIAQRLNVGLAIKTGSPYMTLDAEDIAAMNPQVIILIQPRDVGAPAALPSTALERLGALSTLKLDAVQRGRVAIIDDPESLLPGAPLVDVARSVAEKLRALIQAPAPSHAPAPAPAR
jgi:ABC-type Fe3+-hydroxamate transport system substrate-binding protein